MATNNYNIKPADGWVEIANAPSYVRISSTPFTLPFFLFVGDDATQPALSVRGFKVTPRISTDFWLPGTAGKIWARVEENSPGSPATGSLRIDVISIPSSP